VKEVFGYDAEDEADDWWVDWGSLKLKSAASGAIDFGAIRVEQTVSN
jgi:salicylate hydroxylase